MYRGLYEAAWMSWFVLVGQCADLQISENWWNYLHSSSMCDSKFLHLIIYIMNNVAWVALGIGMNRRLILDAIWLNVEIEPPWKKLSKGQNDTWCMTTPKCIVPLITLHYYYLSNVGLNLSSFRFHLLRVLSDLIVSPYTFG